MNTSLKFDETKYTVENITLDGISITYRAYENIVYVEKPADIKFHILSIFVPEEYYQEKTIKSYSLKTAPVFLPNTVGGYMPGPVEKPGKDFMGRTNSIFYALTKGMIVVSSGVRGRGLKDQDGKFTGTAPAALVDLKAAVRYLRYNKGKVPGDVEKIISNGTSAGGALSSLLGATGNHPDYEPYLKELGAAEERDDIFAASCYCPITNLDHADMAYEWEFNGLNDYHRMKFEPPIDGSDKPRMIPVNGVMTAEQIELSEKEKVLFPEYLNSLGLTDIDGTQLELDKYGNGSFKEYIKKYVMASAQKELEKGTDLSKNEWMTIKDGEVKAIDFDKYVQFRTRMKETPAFDNVSLGTPENELFGTSDIQFRHFTPFSMENDTVSGTIAEKQQVKMMNPMYYIGDDKSTTASFYRIRHGAVDRDTSLAVSAMLTAKLRNYGVEVDYHLPWGRPHSGDYDLDELFTWIERIVK